jgi:hypothetical protein
MQDGICTRVFREENVCYDGCYLYKGETVEYYIVVICYGKSEWQSGKECDYGNKYKGNDCTAHKVDLRCVENPCLSVNQNEWEYSNTDCVWDKDKCIIIECVRFNTTNSLWCNEVLFK